MEGNFSCEDILVFSNRNRDMNADDYKCMGKLMSRYKGEDETRIIILGFGEEDFSDLNSGALCIELKMSAFTQNCNRRHDPSLYIIQLENT